MKFNVIEYSIRNVAQFNLYVHESFLIALHPLTHSLTGLLTNSLVVVFRAAEQARKSWTLYVSQESSKIIGKQMRKGLT